MIKLINIITQIIIVLGCCAILIFTLSDDDIQNNVNTDYNFCVSETFHLKEQIENLIKI